MDESVFSGWNCINDSNGKINWDETTQSQAGYIKEFKQLKLYIFLS